MEGQTEIQLNSCWAATRATSQGSRAGGWGGERKEKGVHPFLSGNLLLIFKRRGAPLAAPMGPQAEPSRPLRGVGATVAPAPTFCVRVDPLPCEGSPRSHTVTSLPARPPMKGAPWPFPTPTPPALLCDPLHALMTKHMGDHLAAKGMGKRPIEAAHC